MNFIKSASESGTPSSLFDVSTFIVQLSDQPMIRVILYYYDKGAPKYLERLCFDRG